MNYFIYTYIISLLTGRYELNKMTSLPMCGFIAQLVEHRTGIAEVTGSNPVEALIFFRLLLSSCLNWKIHCEDHSSLSCDRLLQKAYWSTWHERGTKKKSEFPTGIEPMTSRTPGGRSIHWTTRTHGEQGHSAEFICRKPKLVKVTI